MGSELPLALPPLVTVKGDEKLMPHLTCIVCRLYQLNNSLTMHTGVVRLINLGNRLWLVLSNASDASKNAVPCITYVPILLFLQMYTMRAGPDLLLG